MTSTNTNPVAPEITTHDIDAAFDDVSQIDPGMSREGKALAALVLVLAALAISWGAWKLYGKLRELRAERKELKSEWAETYGKDVGLRDAMIGGAANILKLRADVNTLEEGMDRVNARLQALGKDSENAAEMKKALEKNSAAIAKLTQKIENGIDAKTATEIAKSVIASEAKKKS